MTRRSPRPAAAPRLRRCWNCNAPIGARERFCPRCSARQGPPQRIAPRA